MIHGDLRSFVEYLFLNQNLLKKVIFLLINNLIKNFIQ